MAETRWQMVNVRCQMVEGGRSMADEQCEVKVDGCDESEKQARRYIHIPHSEGWLR